MFFQSRVPLSFWGECVLTAVFLINRTPSRLLQWKLPYQLLNNRIPDYTSMKVFGSLCFAPTLPHGRNKFQPRFISSVFVGYSHEMKAYKLYDIEQKKFFTSRDIIFHENTFPFHHISGQEAVIDPFSGFVLPKSFPDRTDVFMPQVDSLHENSQKNRDNPNNTPSALNSSPDIVISQNHLATQPVTAAPQNSQPIAIITDSQLSPLTNEQQPLTRKSTKISKPPSYLQAYHCNLIANTPNLKPSAQYPLAKYLSYQNLSLQHRNFVINLSAIQESRFYNEAVNLITGDWQ